MPDLALRQTRRPSNLRPDPAPTAGIDRKQHGARLTDEIGFDGRHQRYHYNAAGELTHLIEAGGSDYGPGKITHFERDALGRLPSKKTEGDSECVATFTYDKLGNLTAADNPAAQIAFAYDPAGQLLTESQALSGGDTRILEHNYDILGNRTTTHLPEDRKLHWLFYGSGHLHQVDLEANGENQTLCETGLAKAT